jgi:hypothetical protein
MNRPRVPLGLEATRATLNRGVCEQVGRALTDERRARDLSIQAVATRLLLSPVQVAGLEDVNPEAFYSAEFYVNALRKYASLLEIDTEPIDRILVAPVQEDRLPNAMRSAARTPSPTAHPVKLRTAALVIAFAIVAALAAWPLRSTFESLRRPSPSAAVHQAAESAATPSQPVVVATPALATSAAEPNVVAALDVSPPPAPDVREVEEPADGDLPQSFGRVRVANTTWIFVRYANNSTVERGLAAGDEFVLRDVPSYLMVGSADGTDVEIAGHRIESERFLSNGQIRIGASALAKLRQ